MSARLERFAAAIGRGWAIAGCTPLLLVAVEGASRVAYRMIAGTDKDPRAEADAFGAAEWVDKYLEENRAVSNVEWEPYLYWRRLPFDGTHVNVGEDGLRASWQPEESAAGDEVPVVWFFGGSTMWGTGVRDDFTIPSLVAKNLTARGVPVSVVNFGETGYVSTQELVALELALRDGGRPDIVVLVDGVNDTFSSFQNQCAGLPQNEMNRVREFNSLGRRSVGGAMKYALDIVVTVKLIRRVLGITSGRQHLVVKPGEPFAGCPDGPPASVDDLAGRTVDAYLRNLELMRALATEFGFRLHSYWQPTVVDKEPLTAYERARRADVSAMIPLLESTNAAAMAVTVPPHGAALHRDISRSLRGRSEPLFIDWCHMAETGNAILADIMAEDALPFLNATR